MGLEKLINAKIENSINDMVTDSVIKESIYDVLDNIIYNILTEEENKEKKEKNKNWFKKDNTKFLKKIGIDTDSEYDEDKLKTVSELLTDPKINGAEIARQLWNLKSEEEDAARSLFSKKKRAFKDDNGHTYGFTPTEVNRLYAILTKS